MSINNSLLGLKIMDLLREFTDKDHGLTQKEIVKLLKIVYRTEVDRKTVGRNISILIDYDKGRYIGYKTATRMQNGEESEIRTELYYKSDYEEGEMQVLFDSILSNRHISMKYTKDLIEKISENNKWFKKKGLRDIAFYDTCYKQEIPYLFLNTEKIMEAIEQKKDIAIRLCEYDEKLKLVEGRELRVAPVRLFMYEQTYYLLAIRHSDNPENDSFLWKRLAIFQVADIKVGDMYDTENNAQQEFEEIQAGMDFTKFLETFPYLESTASTKLESMTFVIPKSRLRDVIARFGTRIHVKEAPDSVWWDDLSHRGKMVRVTVRTTKNAMQRFMNEHRSHLYMIEPWYLNHNDREEMKRRVFVNAVVDQVLTDKERDEFLQKAPSVYHLFRDEMARSKTLTPAERDEMDRLVRKMLDMKQDVNKRSYLKDKELLRQSEKATNPASKK